VISICSEAAEVLASLSAASRRHHLLFKPQLSSLHDEHVACVHALLCHLGYSQLEQLQQVRSLTIPDQLPKHLRPLLGKWLRQTGRLARVGCVRRVSWLWVGEEDNEWTRWIDIAPMREDKLPLHSVLLGKYDTSDSLLEAVLNHGDCMVTRVRISMVHTAQLSLVREGG
jgi:hypothetical protein